MVFLSDTPNKREYIGDVQWFPVARPITELVISLRTKQRAIQACYVINTNISRLNTKFHKLEHTDLKMKGRIRAFG